MITPAELESIIKNVFQDAEVTIADRTGQADHYQVTVVSQSFEDVPMMDRHRQVMAVLKPAMDTGRLHAVELKTGVPD